MSSPTPHPARRSSGPLLAVIGILVAIVLVGVRLATQPTVEWISVAGVLVLGGIVAVVVLLVRRSRLAARVRAASEEFPDAVVVPILVGGETAAASRWLARGLHDPELALVSGRTAVVAVDGGGMRVIGARASQQIPAAAIGEIGLGRTRISGRERDAIVVRVTAGDEVAPVALVPTVVRRPMGPLRTDDVADVATRLHGVLHGQDVPRGWEF
jgi:hypothetical protein